MRQRKSSLLSVMNSCRMALLLVSEQVLNRASFRCLGVGVEWGVAGVQKMGHRLLIFTPLDVQCG